MKTEIGDRTGKSISKLPALVGKMTPGVVGGRVAQADSLMRPGVVGGYNAGTIPMIPECACVMYKVMFNGVEAYIVIPMNAKYPSPLLQAGSVMASPLNYGGRVAQASGLDGRVAYDAMKKRTGSGGGGAYKPSGQGYDC